MEFTLSYNEAKAIQERQMVWYRQSIGRQGIKAIKARTKPCPPDLNPAVPVSIFIINDLIPRGGDFERYIKTFHSGTFQNTVDWYHAMEHGKIYH